MIDHAQALGIGLSSFVSVGNKADISGNDLLQYWEEDPATDVCVLYLESFGNPRKFARVARRVSRRKPIVAVKSGRSAAGARATSSHTGALLAASDVTVDALFRQAGVIRTDTLAELFDAVRVLANQPLPKGSRVAIVTNAGGPGILCADACEAGGLEVVELSAELRESLRRLLPAEASTANPVDMIASATPDQYRAVVEAVASSGEADALIVIFIPPLAIASHEVAAAIRGARVPGDVTLLSVFMSSERVRDLDPIPTYAFPEDAARALSHAVRYGGLAGAEPERLPEAGPRNQEPMRRRKWWPSFALMEARAGWTRPRFSGCSTAMGCRRSPPSWWTRPPPLRGPPSASAARSPSRRWRRGCSTRPRPEPYGWEAWQTGKQCWRPRRRWPPR